MADVKYYDVILKPVVTEKSMSEMSDKKYTFYVHPDATKTQIKEAVEKMFDGALAKVRTKVNGIGTVRDALRTRWALTRPRHSAGRSSP